MSLVINEQHALMSLVESETVQQSTGHCCLPVLDELISTISTIFDLIISKANDIITTIKSNPEKYAKLFFGAVIASAIYHAIFALIILRIAA